MKIQEITKMAICIAIICVASYIAFPLPFTPIGITGQTIAINLIGLILTPKQSFIVVLGYLLLGSFGLPVFAGGSSGIGALIGPAGGFLFGFLAVAPLISYFKGKEIKFSRYLFVTISIGMIVLYIFGAVYMSIVQKISIVSAITLAVLPFIVGDFIKCIIASYIGVRLNKVLKY